MKTPGKLKTLDDFEVYTPSQLRAFEAQAAELTDDGLTRKQRATSWVCSLIAAAIMVETLFYKFSGAEESVYIFSKMHTEPWWRWGQGIWELLASIGLLFPRLRWAGGILTIGAMGAAILSHMTWLGYSILGDRGLLFGMAWVTFICGFSVLMIHRREIPFTSPLTYW
jgi:putative oxidoreductase